MEILIGRSCTPSLADLFLFSCENKFSENIIRSVYGRLSRSFNLCYGYIYDLIASNNKTFSGDIYPSRLTVEKSKKSDHLASYLGLTFVLDNDVNFSTKLYFKLDHFELHIVNFLFFSYAVNISQLS